VLLIAVHCFFSNLEWFYPLQFIYYIEEKVLKQEVQREKQSRGEQKTQETKKKGNEKNLL
jgi:hypothetical protein